MSRVAVESVPEQVKNTSSWRETVAREIASVEEVLARSESRADSEERKAVEKNLDLARATVQARKRPRRLRAWLSGVDIERAWGAVHAAKQALFLLAPEPDCRAQIPLLRSKVTRHLKKRDGRARQGGV